jgi:hypothetical protein
MQIRSCTDNRLLRLSIELAPFIYEYNVYFQPQEIVAFSGTLHSIEVVSS